MKQKIKGILFDLGDTLIDFGRLKPGKLFNEGAKNAYEYLQSLEKPLPSKRWYCLRQTLAIRWKYLVSKFTRREFNSLGLITGLAAEMKHPLTEAQALEVAWQFYKPLTKQASVEPQLPELLAKLSDSNLTLGVVSNTFIPSSILDRHLQQLGLLKYLPYRVYSVDTLIRKPDIRIFNNALTKASLNAAETLFVGDTYRKDVRGANRAGMISILKNPKGKPFYRGRKANHTIRKLAELIPIVENYNHL